VANKLDLTCRPTNVIAILLRHMLNGWNRLNELSFTNCLNPVFCVPVHVIYHPVSSHTNVKLNKSSQPTQVVFKMSTMCVNTSFQSDVYATDRLLRQRESTQRLQTSARAAAILNLVERHLSSGSIAKFGKDVLIKPRPRYYVCERFSERRVSL